MNAHKNLFRLGTFTSHAGLTLRWKIECDALSAADWECLAAMIAERVEFESVIGIPRGGLKLAEALQAHVTPRRGVRLVVDDVWTTGGSMRETLRANDIGFVVFARAPIDDRRVRTLFELSPPAAPARRPLPPPLPVRRVAVTRRTPE